eukprot:jgi/Ulvmu1/7572/UM037_0116.1
MGQPLHQRHKTLMDLDDQCVQLILRKVEPIPDRFNASMTCKRMLRLCCDSKLWISVLSEDVPGAPPSKHTHATLQAAVDASRPGDSIHLSPGEHAAEGVRIHHPLRLIGAVGSTLLCRQHASDAALELWSNVKLEHICVEARRAYCVRHHAGDVTLSRCRLVCNAGRFAHLYSALEAAARQQEGCGTDRSEGDLRANRPAGCLTVEETTISGAMRAVQCKGDGELHDVRMLQGWGGLCFWFKVQQAQLAERQVYSESQAAESASVMDRTALRKRKMDWHARTRLGGPRLRSRCQ